MDIIDQWIPIYLNYCKNQRKLSVETIRAYRSDLMQFQIFMQSKHLQRQDISAYVTHLQRIHKPRSVKRKIATMKAFFSFLEEQGHLTENPITGQRFKIKQPFVLPRTIPFEMITALFEYLYLKLETTTLGDYERVVLVRDIAIVELLFGTGIRISELCNLSIDCLDISARYITLLGKGAKERRVQIPNDSMVQSLQTYLTLRPAVDTTYIFLNRRKARLSEQSVRFMLEKHTRNCGIEKRITPHMFRHTFATMLLDEDVDIRYIQQILGHASILTTQIYTHVSSRKQRDILRAKNPRNKLVIGGVK